MKGLVLALALLLACARAASAADVLVLTDIHFNPLADKSLAEPLAAAPAEEWPGILDHGRERLSNYGEDSDWKLLRAALAAVRAQKKPDVVFIAGDFLVHSFRDIFNSSVGAHDDAAYRRFVAKTLRFLALEIESAVPKTPILPALGNNDSDCGDYAIRPGGAFLSDTEATVAGMIGPSLIAGPAGADFAQSWSALGSYAVDDPELPRLRVIALNDNYLSTHYRNSCGGEGDGNPARATLAWLGRALADAAAAQRRVILLYHIPPGTDAFATARHDACPVTPVPLLAEPYARELHALMLRYRATIVADIAGHLHTDAFRVLRDGDKAFGFVMIAPAISPIFGQNPSFRRFTLERGRRDQRREHLLSRQSWRCRRRRGAAVACRGEFRAVVESAALRWRRAGNALSPPRHVRHCTRTLDGALRRDGAGQRGADAAEIFGLSLLRRQRPKRGFRALPVRRRTLKTRTKPGRA